MRLSRRIWGSLRPGGLAAGGGLRLAGNEGSGICVRPREPSNYLPHKYGENCICYTGTHDNETLRQWCAGISPESDAYARDYLGISKEDDLAKAIIEAGAGSKAKLFVAQMQDYLGLGGEARMNEPGTLKPENWRWRMLPGQASEELAQEIYRLTRDTKRV